MSDKDKAVELAEEMKSFLETTWIILGEENCDIPAIVHVAKKTMMKSLNNVIAGAQHNEEGSHDERQHD